MKIGIFHGYELIGSGSNQATSYLAKTLKLLGHEVHIICREPSPESFDFIDKVVRWDGNGNLSEISGEEKNDNCQCILHQMPLPSINAVYITDTQRPGNVKAFNDLTDSELKEYNDFVVKSLKAVLTKYPVEILHCNHLVYQPVAAMHVCKALSIPYIINPRGSAIEYTINHDARYKELAKEAILCADGLIIGNEEVRDRITNLYPDIRNEIVAKTAIVGLGVDTSLFLPVEKSNRNKTIKIISEHGAFGGKSPELSMELFDRLKTGDIDAVTGYRNSYQVKKPDSNLIEKLDNIPWNDKILAFVGATIVGKGLQTIIVALPFILKKHPDTHFVIIGSGASREIFEALVFAISSNDEHLLDKLVEKGYDLDPVELNGPWTDVKTFLSDSTNRDDLFKFGTTLSEHVHFLGRLDHDLLRYVFPCCDIGLFPSIIPEAYGNVVFESLSSGVLPMASYFSGLACSLDDLVPHMGEELVDRMKIPIIDETRIIGLIENLSYLLENNTAEKISSKLREVAIEIYDWKIRAKQMVVAYSKFIENYSSGPKI